MSIVVGLLIALLRLTGFFTEPRLEREQIHAVTGEPSRVMWPQAPDRALTVVTWNIERGVAFDQVASVLDELDADVILLQEVDRFCGRSGDRDVARDLAVRLRMNFVSAGEFQEIGEGSREKPCVSGQAILSRSRIEDPFVVQFTDQASLKWRLNPVQPRRGGRMALRVRTSGATFYSVHLESGGDEVRRAKQVGDLAADARATREVIVIGGDFNNQGDSRSPMFRPLVGAGFTNAMDRTTARHVARRPIDWIFTRHAGARAEVVRAAEASDHDPVVATVEVQSRF